MQVQIETFLAKNSAGESIFKIEMINNECDSWLNFKCVFIIEYNKHPEMKKSVIELTSPEITPEREMNIIQGILTHVTKIEGIKQCKIDETTDVKPDAEKKFNGLLVSMAQKVGNELTPFSAKKNGHYFRKLVFKLSPHLADLVKINRKLFEDIIFGVPELEEEYINQFSTEATFYVISATYAYTSYQFFIMHTDAIVFFFFTES